MKSARCAACPGWGRRWPLKLTIDNLNGAGAIDYSAAICPDAPLTIERVLNTPSRCTGLLEVGAQANPGSGTALLVPVRRGRVVVSADSGTVLFTGYLATEPVPLYAGVGLAGPVYRVAFTAISDEWLLDKQTLTLTGAGFAATGGTLLDTLTNRIAAGLLTTSGVVNPNVAGVFVPEAAMPWSTNASGIAGSTYAAYRVLDGALVMQLVGSVTHVLDFDDSIGVGGLKVSSLKTSMTKELANDVTLSGQIEPTAYVQRNVRWGWHNHALHPVRYAISGLHPNLADGQLQPGILQYPTMECNRLRLASGSRRSGPDDVRGQWLRRPDGPRRDRFD